MPVKVRPRRSGEGGKPWKIVNAETGKVEAESDTQANADASARARNAAIAGHPVGRSAEKASRRKDGGGCKALLVSLIRAVNVSGEGSAQVTGADATRRESLEGAPRRRRRERRRRRRGDGMRGRDLLRAALTQGLDTLCKQTKREQGQNFRAGDYAYVPDRTKPSTWKLRLVESPGGPPTRRQVGMAVAALGPAGFRGQKVQIPRADLAGVKQKVAAAFRKVNPGRDLPPVLRG
jgi:hypothetical protein